MSHTPEALAADKAAAKARLAAARLAVGGRVKAARIGAGYESAADFAKAVGVGSNSVYRWETGRIVPDIFSLGAIARACRVTTDWLIHGEGVHSAVTIEALARWRATHRGRGASDDALRFLESLPLDGYTPTHAFYDLALIAFENGLDPKEAASGARFMESKLR